VKRHQIGKKLVAGPDHLKKLVISALRRLQKLQDVVSGSFMERHVRCSLQDPPPSGAV